MTRISSWSGLFCSSVLLGDEKERSTPRKSNLANRKRLGRDLCLQETSILLRALKSEYHRLQTEAKRLKNSHHDPGATSTVPDSSRSPQQPCIRDFLSHAIVAHHMHLSSFVNSDVARFIVPFQLDQRSIFLDCSNSFAEHMGQCRDVLIRDSRLSHVLAPTSFQRLFGVLSVLTKYPVVTLRNVPGYVSNTLCDVVASVEHDESRSGADSSRKLLQMIFVNVRRLDVPSAVLARTRSSRMSRPDDMLIDEGESSTTAYPSPAFMRSDAVFIKSSSSSTDNKSLAVATELAGDQQSMSVPDQLRSTASGPHVVVITPIHELADASSSTLEPHDSLVWISPWDNDDGGLGSPSPFVPVRADTLKGVAASNEDPLQDQVDSMATMSATDTSLFCEVQSQNPVVLFHSIK